MCLKYCCCCCLQLTHGIIAMTILNGLFAALVVIAWVILTDTKEPNHAWWLLIFLSRFIAGVIALSKKDTCHKGAAAGVFVLTSFVWAHALGVVALNQEYWSKRTRQTVGPELVYPVLAVFFAIDIYATVCVVSWARQATPESDEANKMKAVTVATQEQLSLSHVD